MQQENEEIAHFKDLTQKQMTFQNTKQNSTQKVGRRSMKDTSNFNNIFTEPAQTLSHNHTHTFAAAATAPGQVPRDGDELATPPIIQSAAPMMSP